MALVPSSHTPSQADPTATLQQALAGFEGSLTQEQKQQYQASTAKPDITSVISFVTEIDAKNNGTQRRCVAARLYTFLDATQQFTAIVDTFVSSNPKIAALIWGGIKTTILTVNNVVSYFDKVTGMIMTIGRSCPTYQEFGQLYPGSVGLQGALCDYYACIFRLCTKLIEVSQRTGFTQMASSIFVPFESEFKSFLENLDQATKEIQLQTSLASQRANEEAKKLLELESKDNAKFRQWSLKFHKESRREQEQAHQWRMNQRKRDAAKLKSRIRDNLSTINYVKPWKQAVRQRVPSTGEWLQQESAFCQWRDGDKSAVLWCSGTMGMGKTVLMSSVVAQLHNRRKPNDVVAYYFCRSDDVSSLSARNIFGSLARQILDFHLEYANDEILQPLYESTRGLDTADVVDLIMSYVKGNKTYYLVLDGLDECDNDEVEIVTKNLARLYERRGCFKVICAGRPTLETLLFKVTKPDYKVSITEMKVKSDMDHYIDMILGCSLEEGQLKLGDPRIIVKISEALREGSNGMFLWTRLVIEELCAQSSDNDILKSLDNLPRGLSEIFDRKISRVRERRTAKEAIKLLQFCGVVKRPLTVMEYQEVLSVHAGQKSLDTGAFPNDMYKVINDSCGLLFADEEDYTVHYIHDSVKQHLFTTCNTRSADFDATRVDRHIGLLCMTYLDFEDFKGQLMNTNNTASLPIKPLKLGTIPIHQSGGLTSRIALKLLSQNRRLQHLNSQEAERKIEEVLKNMQSRDSEAETQKRDFKFFNYAWTHYINHLTDVDPVSESTTWRLFCRCVEGKDISANRPWEVQDNNEEEKAFVARPWILTHHHCALFLYHAIHQPGNVAAQFIHEMLNLVRFFEKDRFAEKLVEQVVRHVKASLKVLGHALLVASIWGCIDSVELLLQAGASVDGYGIGIAPLTEAGRGGHLDVVEALLAAGANVHTPPRTDEDTALEAAASTDHLVVVERLLQAGANVTIYRDKGHRLLRSAAENDNLKMVKIFLEAGADAKLSVDAEFTMTPLQVAVRWGNLEIVEILIAAGADVNAGGSTLLRDAIFRGHHEVAERLRAAGAKQSRPNTEIRYV